jgi:hypothetical protein
MDTYLRAVFSEGETLVFPREAAPGTITVEPAGIRLAGGNVKLPAGTAHVVIRGEAGKYHLERVLEIIENIRPRYGDLKKSEEERRLDMIRDSASGGKPGELFVFLNLLGRYALGIQSEADRQAFLRSCALINERPDCSDFAVAGMLRLVRVYKLDEELMSALKKTLLNYRFWMDENGSDGMCFWSENHSLLFHGAQYLAGSMYPDDTFIRSGRTGREQAKSGARRCREWLDDVLADGFEEFLSSGYMGITVAALLNLVDFAPDPDISDKAAKVLDALLTQLCRHAFKGTVIGPQGRVYRDVIYPFNQGTQTIIHYIDTTAPTSGSEWTNFFVTSKYKLPGTLRGLLDAEISEPYPCGNGEIVIHKQKNYILTSLASPRQDGALKWRNISFDADAVHDSFRYTKSLNERFHGTTDFRPGVFGYQQHFWYAALDAECIAFSNLPGGDADRSSMRPGYWYGNGVFPAIKQEKNLLGAVYHIPESYPIHFTHLFFPAPKYDEYRQEQGWLFARKGAAWLGIWCSAPLEWHNDMLSQCELRAYSDRTAYICICSDAAQDVSFDSFITSCKAAPVAFDEGRMQLSYGKDFALRYAVHFDHTQYI